MDVPNHQNTPFVDVNPVTAKFRAPPHPSFTFSYSIPQKPSSHAEDGSAEAMPAAVPLVVLATVAAMKAANTELKKTIKNDLKIDDVDELADDMAELMDEFQVSSEGTVPFNEAL